MTTSDAVSRLFDVAVSGALLITLSPVCCGIAIAVRCDSPGPILHRARRMGRHGRPFTLYKFRTMVPGAAVLGPGITAARDARITRVGRFLRKTKLDELPQLWNVVRGDMSLVGPRPEDPRFLPYYQPEHQLVLEVRPGITGPSQLAFFNEEELLSPADPEGSYIRDVLPRKLSIDLEYARDHRFGQNVRILVRTFVAAVGRGVREVAAG